MDKAKGLIIALVMFFILPAILTMTGFFQDYVEYGSGYWELGQTNIVHN